MVPVLCQVIPSMHNIGPGLLFRLTPFSLEAGKEGDIYHNISKNLHSIDSISWIGTNICSPCLIGSV